MKLKTFIKWQGNKSKHLRHLTPYIPDDYNTYIEPFVGSGALFLHLQPKKWIINDINKDLINCWKQLEDNNADKIIDYFKEYGKKLKRLSKDNKLQYCRELLKVMEKRKYDVLRASLFMFLKYCVFLGNIMINNKFVFKGLELNIFVNNNYTFLKQTYFDKLKNVEEYMQNSNGKIYNKSYVDILNKAKENDFVFLDPPYFEEKNYDFNYNKDEQIDIKFLSILHTQLRKLDKRNVKWMMTQADTKVVRETFKSYKIKKFKAYRIASKSFSSELIIMNY